MRRVDPDSRPFVRLIGALAPWLDQMVVVGGWAHRLYREHPKARNPEHSPLRTLDADVAFSTPLREEEQSIGDALKGAGFQEMFSGTSNPPITRYQLGEEDHGFYAEFLTNLPGGRAKRDGSPDSTVTVAGVTAQKLRYLDLLLVEPWAVTLGANNGFPIEDEVRVQVPNPVSYLIQKILIQPGRRKLEERAKDILYIHDTIDLFSTSLGEIGGLWTEAVRPTLSKRSLGQVKGCVTKMFGTPTDEIRTAARQAGAASGRTLSPETLATVCRAGLSQILSDRSLTD